MPLFPEMLRI